MRVSIFGGDITGAETEALCTSTNRRLTLAMGTGAAVRDRGGFEVLRACEALIAREGPLYPGAVRVTTAGALPVRMVIHCVASDERHHSSDQIIAACVRNAIDCAAQAGCRSVAMPVFAAGHASIPFARSLSVMAATLRSIETTVRDVVIVVNDLDRLDEAAAIVRIAFPGVIVTRSEVADEQPSWWSDDGMFGR